MVGQKRYPLRAQDAYARLLNNGSLTPEDKALLSELKLIDDEKINDICVELMLASIDVLRGH